MDNGYNCDYGGKQSKIFGKEHRKKLSEAFLGKYNGHQNIEFFIDNILYTSIGDASKNLNIPKKTIYNRLTSHNILYNNYRYKNESLIPIRSTRKYNSKPFMIDGIVYNSLKDASNKYGISKSTLMRKLKTGKFPNADYI